MSSIAIIPARGGSKRIPGKNIKYFCGKPIIQYSIERARASGLFKEVIVSTDSQEIADIVIKMGATVPYMRSQVLSDDFTPLRDVCLDVLQWYRNSGQEFLYACVILPTSPFLTIENLRMSQKILIDDDVTSVVPIAAYEYPILRSLRCARDGTIEMFWPEYRLTRSNDLPTAYHDAGQFYWINADKFIANKEFFAEDSKGFILPRYLVQDIDTIEDWQQAELLYQAYLQNQRT